MIIGPSREKERESECLNMHNEKLKPKKAEATYINALSDYNRNTHVKQIGCDIKWTANQQLIILLLF